MKDFTSSNPFFATGRERLLRSNEEYSGYDVIHRLDDNKQIGVVSKDYKVVTHREAIAPIEEALNKLGLRHGFVYELDGDGAKMFATARMLDGQFDPAALTGIKNTALDGERHSDIFQPTIKVGNAYNRSHAITVDFGLLRLWCKNGSRKYDGVDKISIKHIGNIDLDEIGSFVRKNMEASIKGMIEFYVKANKESGHNFMKMLIDAKGVSQRVKKLAVAELSGYGTPVFEETGEKRISQKVVDFKPTEDFSSYLLYNVLTSISSHESRSASMKAATETSIAKLFGV